jgi:hypothetical protein
MGRKVETLIDDSLTSGTHSMLWYASGLPSGIYILILESPAFRLNRKMTLLK